MTKTELLSHWYDRLYNIADKFLKQENPCQIHVSGKTVICKGSLYRKVNALCCDGCKHWKNGCTVKSLACKLWLCPSIKNTSRIHHKLERLNQIAFKFGIPKYCRASKEENFKNL